MAPAPLIAPMPAVAPVSLPWDAELADPVAEIAAAREQHGDTFVVETAAGPVLFLFSPLGVTSFYGLSESTASKGIADWMMLRRKLPDELFDGRRTLPHQLFGRDDTRSYLAALDAAIDVTFSELGTHGVLDVFAFTRRLGHRMGLAAWAGERPTTSPRFDDFVRALDTLDGSAAFVHPEQMRRVAENDKRDERAAMATVERLLAITIENTPDADRAGADDLFGRIVERWRSEPEPGRSTGIARDVILVHLGSMSNLFAATGWMVAQLALHPDVLDGVRLGDDGLAERCALESTRMGQRSIMLRAVVAPTEVSDEHATYRLQPGAQIATLLPLTNSSAMPGLDRYDPDRWNRRRLRDEAQLPARALVTTFGHGEHACPAQPFALAAMCRATERLLDAYDVEPDFDRVVPLAVQIGGVARSQHPCPLRYRAR